MKDRRINYDGKKTVTPRKSRYQHLTIIAVDMKREVIWSEHSNKEYPLEQLPVLCLTEPDSILVGYEIGLAVEKIAEQFKDVPTFQIRVTPIDRELSPWNPQTNPPTKPNIVNHGVSFSFIGWRKDANKNSSWEHRHFPVDPLLFTSSFKAEYKTADKSLEAVIAWAKAVREFLKANDLAFRATQTGIAAQLLRDARFYPDARRKVPKQTNALARANLPGNFYMHNANRNATYNALEVDQNSSHHSCAAALTFPKSDRLFAKGYFRTLPDKAFAYSGTPFFNRLIKQHGLFYVKLVVPTRGRTGTKFVLPSAEYNETNRGHRTAFVYSNEIPELETTGVRVLYIIAAWTSTETDDGLNRFAQWSLQELEQCDANRKRWMKPLLLSAYGLLATRPRPMKAAYFRGKGLITHYHIGRGRVMRFVKFESSVPREPGFVNVIHRGMIEAETRLRSLQMARYLTEHGFEVLTVYADAVYVAKGRQLPLLPNGWEVKAISNAFFPNANQVVCDQFVKLPGTAGRQRRTLVDEIRGKVNATAI